MTLAALKALIDSEPANSGRSHAEVLAWLDAPVAQVGTVTHGKLIAWAGGNDLFAAMRAASAGPAGLSRGLADAALAVIDRGEGLDLADSEAQAMVQGLVTVGLITAEQSAELYAAATANVPRWQSAGLSRPTINEVTRVRAG